MSYKKLSEEERAKIIKEHNENKLIKTMDDNLKKYSDNDVLLAVSLAYAACGEDTPVSEYNNILLCELKGKKDILNEFDTQNKLFMKGETGQIAYKKYPHIKKRQTHDNELNKFTSCVDEWHELSKEEKEKWAKRAEFSKDSGYNLFFKDCKLRKVK